jgi:hypothetical protein
MPFRSRSKSCRSGLRTTKFLNGMSGQSRSGGGGGMHTVGYSAAQRSGVRVGVLVGRARTTNGRCPERRSGVLVAVGVSVATAVIRCSMVGGCCCAEPWPACIASTSTRPIASKPRHILPHCATLVTDVVTIHYGPVTNPTIPNVSTCTTRVVW